VTFGFCSSPQYKTTRQKSTDTITRVEMNLSAFGVESDDFPSIDVLIDFTNDSSICKKSYYNPAFKPSTYKLSNSELKNVLQLLQASDLGKLKTDYKVARTDQPTSTTKIYTTQKTYVIKDYGLEGDYPLKELYRIVYKL
jgi:hypothetical protein